ncbi:MAG TPA: protein kinase [Planctomycetota bacterium]|nr:protein kinase [Planctomycetota bacterium]
MDYPNVPSLPDLNEYELVARTGARSAGSSILLRHSATGERVFAKVIPESSISENALFARLSAALEIGPRLIGVGSQEGRYVILRQYVDGCDLASFLVPGKRLPHHQCIDLLEQACTLLDQAHRAGFCHGRIKPSNIILTADGVSVTELHIPYLKYTDLSVTRTGFCVESPLWLAPEAFAEGYVPGIAADIFCLGCVAYNALTGTHPFAGDTTAEIKENILHLSPRSPSTIVSEIPESLSYVIMKMLEKDNGRYQTPAGILKDIEAIRQGIDPRPAVAPVETLKDTKEFPRKKALLIAGSVALIAAVGVLTYLGLERWSSGPVIAPPEGTGETPSVNAPADSAKKPRPTEAADRPEERALKEALALIEKSPEDAVAALDRIIRDYPGSPATARALQERTRITGNAAQSVAKQKDDIDAAAQELLQKDKFGEAIALYTRFLESCPNDKQTAEQIQLTVMSIKAQAEKRFTELKSRAEGHAAKKPEEAMKLYESIRDSFGIEEYVQQAAKEIEILDPLAKTAGEKQAAEQKLAARKALQDKLLPAEKHARAWQFSDAAAECDKLVKNTKEEAQLGILKQQLREYELLAGLKWRLMSTLNASQPTMISLNIGRDLGTITGSHDTAIIISLEAGEAEERWEKMPFPLVDALVTLALRKKAGDTAETEAGLNMAAGILFARYGQKESASQKFDAAEKAGEDVSALREMLASDKTIDPNEILVQDLLNEAESDIKAKRWAKAQTTLLKLQSDYGPSSYTLKSRSRQVEQWLVACRGGAKAEAFKQAFKQGEAVDPILGSADMQWQITGGRWSVNEGGLMKAQNPEKRDVERLMLLDCPPQYILKTSFRVVSGSGLLLRLVSSEGVAYDFMVDVNNPKVVGLWFSQKGRITSTQLKEMRFAKDTWYDLVAYVRPHAITVRCGDVKFSVDNQVPPAKKPQFGFGFLVRQESTAEFRDASIQALKRQ